ncbi:Uncharacterised protein [Chryseobacterium nakagawai]|uniref:Uncharacterized protein n=1 Tax=Chryseobacterium nakagawai TaxID=1241982 RepID=A0AAD0YFI1_CHRNA|nr:hypothetical protein [Chryseobacterium nakagawai]AZA89212.1 hypothetical protein EG343_00470 [Chryseobacterium nakagawai]VEH20541.1 Uncharacterised protein [Chryseobacterium nakagawai]
MKIPIFLFLVFAQILHGQDRLSFVKDPKIKMQMQNSIEYLNRSPIIADSIKKKTVFITFDFDEIEGIGIEGFGINYSTYIPMLFSKINNNGQLTTSVANKILYYNYSKNIVFVFFKGFKYFDLNTMAKMSNDIQIKKENLTLNEYFTFKVGQDLQLSNVENTISFNYLNDSFVPVRLNTFDLKTFMEVWYGIEVIETTVSQNRDLLKQNKDK